MTEKADKKALNCVVKTDNMCYVFHNGNVSTDGRIAYLPIYMLMFLQKEEPSAPQIYKPDLDGLQ